MLDTIVLTSSEKRLSIFTKYYSLYEQINNINLILVIDDRKNKITIDNKIFSKTYFISDIISNLKEKYRFNHVFDSIIDIYPVSIKLLLPLFFNKKIFLLDDDTVFLRNLNQDLSKDHYYVKDFFSSIKERETSIKTAFENTFIDDDIVLKINKNILNSGTLILDISVDNVYSELIQTFFNSEHMLKLFETSNRKNNKHTGNVWRIEQMIYSLYFSYLNEKNILKNISFGGKSMLNKNCLKKSILHFTSADKDGMTIGFENLVNNV